MTLDQVRGWCVALAEIQNYSQRRRKLCQGNESCCSTDMSWNLNFGFLHLYFKLSFFKTCRSIACSFLHLHWCTDTYNSEHLNVWCFGLIFVESRGEFWEVSVFVYPDLSSHGIGVSWLPDTLSILSGWLTAHLTCKILVIVWLKVAL